MRILITGGGTGGHISPALAAIAELRRRDPDVELRYVGSREGRERDAAAGVGVSYVGISTGKLRRSSKGVRGLFTVANARDALRVPLGFLQALKAVRVFRPDAVLSTGGYVCVPAVVAAWVVRRPVLVHEQTASVGLANRLASRFATRIALSFEGSESGLPRRARKRSRVVGNPVRDEIFAGDRERAGRRFGFDPNDGQLPCIYVTGGVQGSEIVNRTVADAAPELLGACRILHQCGAGKHEPLLGTRASLDPAMARRWVIVEFVELDAIADAFALADLVVSRAGAGTVAELGALGKPSILVPLVPSSGDEQAKNAARLVEVGGAVVIRQADCNAASMVAAVTPLLGDAARRETMATGARRLATPRAAGDLVDELLALAPGS